MFSKITILRQILASFLPDSDTIREFEKLFRNQNKLVDYDEYRSYYTTVTSDTQLENRSCVALVDATSNAINITLPDPTVFESRSIVVTITKTDSSVNAVNILPFDSETVAGSASESLLKEQESLSFITDGTNWHIGS